MEPDKDPGPLHSFFYKYYFSRFDESKDPIRCCGKETCLSLAPLVAKLLDKDVLAVQLAHRNADLQDQNQLRPENYRFLAYRNLFFMVYGRTKAKMTRLPIPSCLVMKVRTIFPDPNNSYTGFKPKRLKK
jgi:hypothetical protein